MCAFWGGIFVFGVKKGGGGLGGVGENCYICVSHTNTSQT